MQPKETQHGGKLCKRRTFEVWQVLAGTRSRPEPILACTSRKGQSARFNVYASVQPPSKPMLGLQPLRLFTLSPLWKTNILLRKASNSSLCTSRFAGGNLACGVSRPLWPSILQVTLGDITRVYSRILKQMQARRLEGPGGGAARSKSDH